MEFWAGEEDAGDGGVGGGVGGEGGGEPVPAT